MYIGIVETKGYCVRDFVAYGGTISEIVKSLEKQFAESDMIDEFDEEEITFYRATELTVQKRVEYVITGEIAE